MTVLHMPTKCLVSARDYRRHWKGQTTMTGTIKTLHADKGFGFILGEDRKEYFFHRSALKNARFEALETGQEVTFEDAEGSKGPRAEDVYV